MTLPRYESVRWANAGVFKNGPTPAPFSYIFSLFKQTLQVLQKINVKYVHPIEIEVYT